MKTQWAWLRLPQRRFQANSGAYSPNKTQNGLYQSCVTPMNSTTTNHREYIMNKDLNNINEELENTIEALDDDALTSVAGGCIPNCGGGGGGFGTTPDFSCNNGFPCP